MNVKKAFAVVCAFAIGCLAVAAEAPTARRHKMIGFGWDLLAVSPEEVLANADALDATGLDGVTLMLEKTLADGRKISFKTVMNDGAWPADAFAEKPDVFRRIVRHPALAESFLLALWAPKKRLDWSDDAAWAAFAGNMAAMARLAKAGGLRGVMVDVEDYPRTRQYFWTSADGAYGDIARIARRRGGEVARQMFAAYPEMVLMSTWFLTLNSDYFGEPNPLAAARANNDLWPAFVNGLLDELPATARLVDGNEHAYSFTYADHGYSRSACQQRVAALGLVRAENRAKYRSQMDVGFGFYMDCYLVPPTDHYYREPINGSKLAHFDLNLREAVSGADEYVWLYGEKKSWIRWQGVANRAYAEQGTWEELMPGLADSLRTIKDPLGEVRRGRADFARMKNPQSLVANGACRVEGALGEPGLQAGVVPAPYEFGGDEKLAGTGGVDTSTGDGDSSSLCIAGPANACFTITMTDLKPGERYLVRLSAKGAKANVRLYWKNGRVWQWQMTRHRVQFPECRDGEWRRGCLVVRVPAGADGFGLQMNGALGVGEKVWYDNVTIYRIEE